MSLARRPFSRASRTVARIPSTSASIHGSAVPLPNPSRRSGSSLITGAHHSFESRPTNGCQILLEIFQIVLCGHLSGAGIVHHLPEGHARISCGPRKRELPVAVQPYAELQLAFRDRARRQLAYGRRPIGLLDVSDEFQLADQRPGSRAPTICSFFTALPPCPCKSLDFGYDGRGDPGQVVNPAPTSRKIPIDVATVQNPHEFDIGCLDRQAYPVFADPNAVETTGPAQSSRVTNTAHVVRGLYLFDGLPDSSQHDRVADSLQVTFEALAEREPHSRSSRARKTASLVVLSVRRPCRTAAASAVSSSTSTNTSCNSSRCS